MIFSIEVALFTQMQWVHSNATNKDTFLWF